MNLISTRKEKYFSIIVAIILHILILLLFIFYKVVEKSLILDLSSDNNSALMIPNQAFPAPITFAMRPAQQQNIQKSKPIKSEPVVDIIMPEKELDQNKPLAEQLILKEDYSNNPVDTSQNSMDAYAPDSGSVNKDSGNKGVANLSLTDTSANSLNEQFVQEIESEESSDEPEVVVDQAEATQSKKPESQDSSSLDSASLSSDIFKSLSNFSKMQLEMIDTKNQKKEEAKLQTRLEQKSSDQKGLKKNNAASKTKFTGKDLLNAFKIQASYGYASRAQQPEQDINSNDISYGSGVGNGSGSGVPQYLQARAQEFKAQSYTTRLTRALEKAFRMYCKDQYFDEDCYTYIDLKIIIGRDGKIKKVHFEKATGLPKLDSVIESVIMQCEQLPIPNHLNAKEFVYPMSCGVFLNKGHGKIAFKDSNRSY